MFFNKKTKSKSPTNAEFEPQVESPPPSSIECAGRTDIGMKRMINQDQFLIADLHKNMHVRSSSYPNMREQLFGETLGKLMFVADGVGGGPAGEIASQMAIQSMAQFLLNSMHWLFNPKQPEIDQFVEDLKAGAMRSHETVRGQAEVDPNWRGMGTTLTAAYLMWPMAYVLHVGDSRCYVLRDGTLELLTKDQTLAQHLSDCGQLKGAEFESSPYHHVLLSSIGSSEDPHAVVYKTRLRPGDRMLLCSDGVNAHLNDSDIELILASNLTSDEICRQFIETAKERGGRDNITAVVAIAHP